MGSPSLLNPQGRDNAGIPAYVAMAWGPKLAVSRNASACEVGCFFVSTIFGGGPG